jgi:hypothetical protein
MVSYGRSIFQHLGCVYTKDVRGCITKYVRANKVTRMNKASKWILLGLKKPSQLADDAENIVIFIFNLYTFDTATFFL